MEKSILEFAGRLRTAGVKVSPAEVLDAFEALPHIGLEDRSLFKDSLRGALVKRGRDIPIFDELFDLHFSGRPVTGVASEEPDQPTGEDITTLLAETLETYQTELSLVTELIMSGQFGPLTRLLLDRGQALGLDRMESPLQVNFFLRRFRKEMDLDQVRAESNSFLNEVEERGLDRASVEALRDYVDRNLESLEEEVRGIIRKELGKNRFLFLRRIKDEEVAERSLARLSEEDILSMRPAVERLARRLKDRLSLRLRRAETGRLDLKTTLRKNIGYGGLLPEIRFKKKKPARPQVVALCDVSRSVSNFSRFMLLFLYTLKEVISRVRSFIFVGDLAEVTELFQRRELNEAVAMAAGGRGLTYAFRTDYGCSLAQFAEDFLTAVNSKTTVFILGDARNNYFEPRTEALEAIADRARKLIWLNPEPRLNWRIGDSVMELYRPYCTTVAECGNLRQLSLVVEENLLP